MKNLIMKGYSTTYMDKIQYIKHPYYENLYVIPYVKGRLVFAEIVARAIEGMQFDTILIDMPYFMNNSEILKIAVGFFPYVSSILIKRHDSSFVSIPFVPCDAGCVAMACVNIMNDEGKSLEFKCIDDSNIINYPEEALSFPSIHLKDDYFVFIEGLENYFSSIFKELNNLWKDLSDIQKYFICYRAKIVRERILELIKQKEIVLFVCEYKLWWSLINEFKCDKLSDAKYFFLPSNSLEAVLAVLNPHIMWAKGALDDYPVVVLKFFERLKLGIIGDFDKLEVINEIIKRQINYSIIKESDNPTIRKLNLFQRYLQNRLVMDLRLVPLPITHLYDSSISCIGKTFAKKLAKVILEYPIPDNEQIIKHLNINKDKVLILEGDEVKNTEIFNYILFYGSLNNYLADVFYEEVELNSRLDIVESVYPKLSKKERQELDINYGYTLWEIQSDYTIHMKAGQHALGIAERMLRFSGFNIKRSWGSLGDGIQWRATINSRAKGEDAIYIKEKRVKGSINRIRFDEFTPVVFLLSNDFGNNNYGIIHDSNITLRNIELMNKDYQYDESIPPDCVYSVFFTYKRKWYLCDGHIIKNEITSIAFLYLKDLTGLERYYRITSRHSRFHCRTLPEDDPEINHFPLSEIGIAWAIKYAQGIVLVVAKRDWRPSNSLLKFTKRKKVYILHILLSLFDQEFIERLRNLHLISTSLEKHPNRDWIIRRFID